MTDETEVIHPLIKPIKYTPKNSGDQIEAQFITLNEPSVRNLKTCATLKQAFLRVIAGNESSGEETPAETEKEDSVPMETRIINALYASAEDMPAILLTAKELFRDVGQIDGEKKLTAPMLDDLCIQDIEMMTGKYMANFILASVLTDQ